MQSTMHSASRCAASLVRQSRVHCLPRQAVGARLSSSLSGESFLSGTSAVYVEEMYAAYKKSPARCVE